MIDMVAIKPQTAHVTVQTLACFPATPIDIKLKVSRIHQVVRQETTKIEGRLGRHFLGGIEMKEVKAADQGQMETELVKAVDMAKKDAMTEIDVMINQEPDTIIEENKQVTVKQ